LPNGAPLDGVSARRIDHAMLGHSLIGRRATLGLLAASATAGAFPRRAAAATKLQVGYLPVAAMSSICLDAAKPWAGGDLEVEPLRLQAGPVIAQAIQSGSLVLGEIAGTVALSLASRGIPIVCLVNCNNATRNFPYHRIMVAKSSPLSSVTELEGKTVGVVLLGTIDYLLLLAALRRASVDPKRVNIVAIPVPNQAQALASGQVDAMIMPPPADTVAEMQYGARMLADATEAIPYFPLEFLVADEKWVKENPDLVRRLAAGWITASRWISANQAAARAAASQVLNLEPTVAARMRLPHWSANGLPVMPGVWNLYYLMVSNGVIEGVSDPAAMIQRHFIEPTIRYVLPALSDLGRVADPETESLRRLPLPSLPQPPEAYLGPWEKA
jgi:NitT/TauT family transport system substrate-binding protein